MQNSADVNREGSKSEKAVIGLTALYLIRKCTPNTRHTYKT